MQERLGLRLASSGLGLACLAVALGCLLSFVACKGQSGSGEPRPEEITRPRLIVLYTPCTLSTAYLAPYDEGVSYTPNFQKLAQAGAWFQDHQTESGQSGVSFASLYTGTQSDQHGVYFHPSMMRQDVATLAEVLSKAGYDTWFWNGHRMASGDLGYAKGFVPEHVKFQMPGRGDNASYLGIDAGFQRILSSLQEDASYRAYVQINFTITHGPYHLTFTERSIPGFCSQYPDECAKVPLAKLDSVMKDYGEASTRYRMEYDLANLAAERGWQTADLAQINAILTFLYKVSIWELDQYLGRFLAQLKKAGVDKQTLFVLTSDHGEAMWEEGTLFAWSHGGDLSPEVLRVPMFVRWPQRIAPQSISATTSSIDVLPTVAALAGVEDLPSNLPGQNLAGVLAGDESVRARWVFSHTALLGPAAFQRLGADTVMRKAHPTAAPDDIWVRAKLGDDVFSLVRPDGQTWSLEHHRIGRDLVAVPKPWDAASGEYRNREKQLRSYKKRLVDAHLRMYSNRTQPEQPEDAIERLRSLGYVN